MGKQYVYSHFHFQWLGWITRGYKRHGYWLSFSVRPLELTGRRFAKCDLAQQKLIWFRRWYLWQTGAYVTLCPFWIILTFPAFSSNQPSTCRHQPRLCQRLAPLRLSPLELWCGLCQQPERGVRRVTPLEGDPHLAVPRNMWNPVGLFMP